MDLNTICLVGRIGKDPELRELPGGDKTCTVGVANSSWKKVGEEWKEETSWFDVSFFGKTAERVVEKTKKGSKIAITGSLKQRRWQDADQNWKERFTITGRQVQFLDKQPKKDPIFNEQPKESVPF